MSVMGNLFGGVGASAPPPLPPTPGAAPVAALSPGAGPGSGSVGNGAAGGPSLEAGARGAASQAAAALPPEAAGGTPVTAPATRHAFGQASGVSQQRGRAGAAQSRTWRMADVMAAIGGGPRALRLIEAAGRPGPVEPGSLLEAVKALRPAPTLPQATRTV